MGFSVKVNSISKDLKIPRSHCPEVRKRGEVGVDDQVVWRILKTLTKVWHGEIPKAWAPLGNEKML